jgi:excisionase family DNA binding protein
MIIIQINSEQLRDLVQEAVRNVICEMSPNTAPQPETDQVLTIKEAAGVLNLSVSTLYGLVNRAAVPVYKRSKRLYFSKQELLDWIKEGRKKTASEINAEADAYIDRLTLNNRRCAA